MKDFGEIPAGKNELQKILYPFHTSYPFKIWSKFRWWKNSQLPKSLVYLNQKKQWLTVIDRLGAPGDALITANVISCIKKQFPRLRINCITPNPDLIKFDPNIESINEKETFYSFDSSYWELIVRKEKKQNIVAHNMIRLGIKNYEYKSKFHLTEKEKNWAKKILSNTKKPFISICTKSKELVKNWPTYKWEDLIKAFPKNFSIIHLGDGEEPILKNVVRFAGKFSVRESAALLSQSNVFIGADSLLMHVANGLDIPSVIIFGGSRPVDSFGYAGNANHYSHPDCSPCWIHSASESCKENLKCLHSVETSEVLKSISRFIKL